MRRQGGGGDWAPPVVERRSRRRRLAVGPQCCGNENRGKLTTALQIYRSARGRTILGSGLAAAILLGAVVAVIEARSHDASTDELSEPSVALFEDEGVLVANSDTIVQGTVVSAPLQSVARDHSQVDSRFGQEVQMALYPVLVLEVIKGNPELEGSTIWVKWVVDVVDFGPGVESESASVQSAPPPEIVNGEAYVFFLKNAVPVSGVSDGPLAGVHYFFSGQPSLAMVAGDQYLLTPFEHEPVANAALRSGGSLASLRSLAAVEIRPDETVPDQPGVARGQALEQLVEALPSLDSPDAVLSLVESLGLDAASLGDPPFCRKVQAAIDQFGQVGVNLGCE